MHTVIRFIRLTSPSRSLLLFILFCVFCLSSCAAGDDLEAITDAAVRSDRPLDHQIDADKTIPMFDNVSRADASTNLADTTRTQDASIDMSPHDVAELSSPHARDAMVAQDKVVIEDVSELSPLDVMSVPDVMSMPIKCHTLTVRLNATTMPRCTSGWTSVLYDFDGHPHESTPGGSLAYSICGRLQGQLVLSAHCGGMYLLNWPGGEWQPANRGGVASITLDGSELADAEALLCLDRWSRTPGIRPVIPLEPYFYGRCP